jgi:Fe-S cluster assembly protein SufD
MKEFTLFKTPADFQGGVKAWRCESGSGQSSFHFQEVCEAGLIHDITLHAGTHSRLEVVILQNIPENGNVWIRIKSVVEAHAKILLTVIQDGGQSSQVELDSELLGSDARIEFRGLQNAKRTQKFSVRAEVNHSIPHTSSDLQVWCAARDESRSVFSGSVKIAKGAHHSEAYQKNKNLMLSKRAVVDSFPKLFIENDNVKCAHGSSTSTLEPDQIVYLQARGISAEQAEEMMVQGFLRQAISGVGDPLCRDDLYARLGIREEIWS